jgi:hypothetical protein
MGTLHIAPGHSAGGSLRQAIRGAGRHEEVLFFRDDLSCGPIASEDVAVRVAWWMQIHGDWETEAAPLKAFWERVATTDDRLVVRFGRYSALGTGLLLGLGRPARGASLQHHRRDQTAAAVQPTRRVPGFPADVRSLNHARISIEVFARE